MTGATIGGGVGSIGGPATAAVGAGAGYAIGELAKGEDTADDIKAVKDQVEALSQGDIQKLVDIQLANSEQGFMDKVMSEVWGILKLLMLGTALWIIVPIIYSRYLHKKHEKRLNGDHPEK